MLTKEDKILVKKCLEIEVRSEMIN